MCTAGVDGVFSVPAKHLRLGLRSTPRSDRHIHTHTHRRAGTRTCIHAYILSQLLFVFTRELMFGWSGKRNSSIHLYGGHNPEKNNGVKVRKKAVENDSMRQKIKDMRKKEPFTSLTSVLEPNSFYAPVLLSSTKWWHMRIVRLFQSQQRPFISNPGPLFHVPPSWKLCGWMWSRSLLQKYVGTNLRYHLKDAAWSL